MRLRRIKNASIILEQCSYILLQPQQYRGRWNKVFNNDHPIEIEIGMGKGNFLLEKAKHHPEINFIGVEKYDSVLVSVVKKLENETLPNLRILCMDASSLDEVFDHEITKLYLNFSDPWPKKKHYKRRLTSSVFLKIYDGIFCSEACIEQKTDNEILFVFSLESLSQYGYSFSNVSLDLHQEKDFGENFMTEYEIKFQKEGKRIFHLTATKRK